MTNKCLFKCKTWKNTFFLFFFGSGNSKSTIRKALIPLQNSFGGEFSAFSRFHFWKERCLAWCTCGNGNGDFDPLEKGFQLPFSVRPWLQSSNVGMLCVGTGRADCFCEVFPYYFSISVTWICPFEQPGHPLQYLFNGINRIYNIPLVSCRALHTSVCVWINQIQLNLPLLVLINNARASPHSFFFSSIDPEHPEQRFSGWLGLCEHCSLG